MGEIYSFPRNPCLPILLLSRATERMAGPILTRDGSLDADFAKGVPFRGAKIRLKLLVV